MSEYITENEANIVIDFVNKEIKKAKQSKLKGFSLKEIADIVYMHFGKNTIYRLFSIEYMKSKLGYENNFNDLVIYNRQSFNSVITAIGNTLTKLKELNYNLYLEFNFFKEYAKITKNHISLIDINYNKLYNEYDLIKDMAIDNLDDQILDKDI
tara:strand:+ start:189 stop:650 length:462 start_codon:yes stop_codon:yes gene_type:complete